MVKCPKCKKEVTKPEKKWKYGIFSVEAYSCEKCNTQFREYCDKKGKNIFTLKLEKGKGYVKA